MKKTTIYLSLAITMLNGCVSQDYRDTKAEALATQQQMDQARETQASPLGNVSFLSKPPAIPTPIKRDDSPAWLKETVRLKATQLPLSLVLTKLFKGTGIDVVFDPDANPNAPVTINMDASRKSIINILTSITRYAITTEGETVRVGYYQSDTFALDIPSGKYSGQQGGKGEQSGSDAENGGAKVTGQYLTTTYDNVDIVEQVANAMKAILIDEQSDDEEKLVGSVKVVPGLSAITVRTTPSRMAQVRQLVDTYQAKLNDQVLLEALILEFRSNLGKDQGIDWNLLKNVGNGSLKFIIPGTSTASNIISGSSGLAFTGRGKWDGTTAFIKALEQQGTVSTSTPINILTLSSQPAHIAQTLTTPYLSDISKDVTDTTTSTSTTRGKVKEGIDMMVNTNVKDNFVWIRTTGKLTKIAGDYTDVIDNAKLRFISTRDADLSFTNKVRYGQTVVLGSIKQQTKTANKSSSFGLDGLGSQASGHETVETLVLLTPRRVK
ncbi:type II and III secretion system protein [Vibrio harveyi]|nr:type II and III secretion system protein [Vibrio harveyi]